MSYPTKEEIDRIKKRKRKPHQYGFYYGVMIYNSKTKKFDILK